MTTLPERLLAEIARIESARDNLGLGASGPSAIALLPLLREAAQSLQAAPEVGDVVGWIMRDVCESESADPERADTICIRFDALQLILENYLPASPAPAGG